MHGRQYTSNNNIGFGVEYIPLTPFNPFNTFHLYIYYQYLIGTGHGYTSVYTHTSIYQIDMLATHTHMKPKKAATRVNMLLGFPPTALGGGVVAEPFLFPTFKMSTAPSLKGAGVDSERGTGRDLEEVMSAPPQADKLSFSGDPCPMA
jgi:hypothetical protein